MAEQNRQPENLSPDVIERVSKFVADIASGKGPPPISFSPAPATTYREIEDDMASGRLRRLPVFECSAQLGIFRLQFIQACERLQIKPEMRPRFEIHATSLAPVTVQPHPLVVDLPAFDVRHDSEKEWLSRADRAWKRLSRQIAKECINCIRIAERSGIVISVKRSRSGSSNQAMRMEWAALHYCKKWSYRRIQQSPKHNPKGCGGRQITTAVQRILREVGLSESVPVGSPGPQTLTPSVGL